MFEFSYFTPTRVVFGKDAECRAGEMAQEAGARHALLVYGGGHALASGLVERVRASLRDAGISFAELGGVKPNPLIEKAYEALRLAETQKPDLIIAIGGGSVIDTAKAIGYALAEPDLDVWELFAHARKAKACLPIAAIPTIAAAGSEMSDSCVMTNGKTSEKRGYSSDLCRPRFALLNPELTYGVPPWHTACGNADILMHTMERYFTNGGNLELTDSIAEGLMRTVMHNALIVRDDPRNGKARAELMWASCLSHNGLTGCGNGGNDFASHMLEHELSGFFDVTHGAGLTAVWGSWARYVYKNCLPRFEKFALSVMGVLPGGNAEETALRGIEAMEEFFRSLGLPTDIRGLGIELADEQIAQMARSAALGSGGGKGSAKFLAEKDIAAIYAMARG